MPEAGNGFPEASGGNSAKFICAMKFENRASASLGSPEHGHCDEIGKSGSPPNRVFPTTHIILGISDDHRIAFESVGKNVVRNCVELVFLNSTLKFSSKVIREGRHSDAPNKSMPVLMPAVKQLVLRVSA